MLPCSLPLSLYSHNSHEDIGSFIKQYVSHHQLFSSQFPFILLYGSLHICNVTHLILSYSSNLVMWLLTYFPLSSLIKPHPLFSSLTFPFLSLQGAKFDVSNKQRLGFSEVQLVQKMIDGTFHHLTPHFFASCVCFFFEYAISSNKV